MVHYNYKNRYQTCNKIKLQYSVAFLDCGVIFALISKEIAQGLATVTLKKVIVYVVMKMKKIAMTWTGRLGIDGMGGGVEDQQQIILQKIPLGKVQ